MTGDEKGSGDKEGLSLDLDEELEWDDALEEWEQELGQEGAAKAESPPMPAPPKQPLYRPQTSLAPEPEPEVGRPSSPGEVSLFDDDGDGYMEETRLSDPPEQLLNALEDDATTNDSLDSDLDLDALLDGLEMPDPEAAGPTPVKDVGAAVAAAAVAPPAAPPAAPPKPEVKKPWAPPPPKPRAPAKAGKRPAYQPPAPKPRRPARKAPLPPPTKGRAKAPAAGLRPRPIAPFAAEEADESTPIVDLAELTEQASEDAFDDVTRLAPTSKALEAEIRHSKTKAGPVPPPLTPGREPAISLSDLDEPEISFGEPDEDEPEISLGDVDDDEPDISFGEPDDDEPELSLGDVDDDEPELSLGDVDDDEPELSLGDVDDDEPEISLGDVDDDFPEIGAGDDFDDDLDGLDGFEDLDDEQTEFGVAPSVDAPEPTAQAVPTSDAGAQAAARTVRYRKPRQEHFPLVGRDPDAMRARRELLRTLADKTTGAPRARLLVATAELSEQLGEADSATELYRDAHAADPHDVVALRALRRDAVQRGEWFVVAALLEEETKLPLSAEARAAAFTLLAEVQLTRIDDAAAAQKSARSALGLRRGSVAAALLLAETGLALQRDAEALTAIERAAEHWNDGPARGALLGFVGLAAERAGRHDKALDAFGRAAEADSEAFDAMLGLARAERAAKDLDATVVAVARAGEHAGEGPLAEAYRRASARIVHLMGKRPSHATALLFDAKGVLAQRARADAARESGDAAARAVALDAWAGAAGGSERALALTTLAEVRADGGDFEGADAALRDAALADNNLGTIRLVRELVSRRAPSGSRFAEGDDLAGSAIVSAAKLAREGGPVERELMLLKKAEEEGDAPATADVLALDLATAASDIEAVLMGLGREVERASAEQKVGPLLTLALEARLRGDLSITETLLEQAREVQPGHPVALRTLARHMQVAAPIDAAQCWLEEASAASGGRSAFAATNAGHLLSSAGQDPDEAYKRALEAVPAYGPAAWSLEPIVRGRGDAEVLAAINIDLGDAATDPVERGGRYVRAALLTAGTDLSKAGGLLDQARDAVPEDGILVELSLRLADNLTPSARAALLTTGAEKATPALRRSMLLRAAAAHADGGEPAEAAAIYRRVLEEQEGSDPLAMRALDQCEIAAAEVSRVASRRFDAVKNATDDEARVQALQALADLDLHDREDPASAVLSLQSILEVSPGHLPSLRALERYFMDQARLEELIPVEAALVTHLSTADAGAHARLHTRLRLAPADAVGDAADNVLLEALEGADPSFWLARHAHAAARATENHEAQAKAAVSVYNHYHADMERAEGALRAAEALSAAGRAADGVALLDPALSEAPLHLPAARALALRFEEAGDHEGTARAYELAGRAASSPETRAELFHAAGVVLEDHLGLPEQAAVVYAEAAQANVTHADLFGRYRAILEKADDKEGLATLTERRIAAGGDVAVLAELQSRVAALREQLGDQTGAKDALRAALSFEGENADALKRLAELCLAGEDWRGAAEALIRLARVRKDREELRWVFFTLGNIYDTQMPDSRRAEAAYRRVLKLIPADVEAMERLANLYEREKSLDKAVEMLKLLADNELDPDTNRDHRLRLSATLEQRGDLRGAEAVLEQTRKNAPVDLVVLKGLADLYKRQNAPQALSMHLNRAVADFRHAIDTDSTDSAAWVGLTEILDWRGRPDAARVVASGATTLGIQSDQLTPLVDAHGGVSGAGAGASSDELDEMLSARTIPRAARAIFQTAHDAFEKALPYDSRAVRADKVPARKNTWAAAGKDIARWFDVSDAQIQVTHSAPRVCVPVSMSPFTVLIGSDVYDKADDREQRFLLARAAKIVQSGLVVAARSQPRDLALAVAGLIRSYDPMYAPAGFDTGELDGAARRVGKAISRRLREPLQPLVLEMAGTHGFDPARLGLMACELGDRAALLATGALPAAVTALLKLAGRDDLEQLPSSQRINAIRRVTEAKDLFEFALSDVHFEIRARAGVGGA